LPNVKMTGSFISPIASPDGFSYRYETTSDAESKATIQNAIGTMSIDDNFKFNLQVTAPVLLCPCPTPDYPADIRVKFTDSDGDFVEIDAQVINSNMQSIDITSLQALNPLFDFGSVQTIEFIHSNAIVGTNGRARVNVEIDGLIANVDNIPGDSNLAGNPVTDLNGFPSTAPSTNFFISAVEPPDGDFHYRYDLRDSIKREVSYRIKGDTEPMDVGDGTGIFTIHLMVQDAATAIVAIDANMAMLLKMTDVNGKVAAVSLNLEKDIMNAYTIDFNLFQFDFDGFDETQVTKIELVHNHVLLGSTSTGDPNTRAEIVGMIDGLASGITPISGDPLSAGVNDPTALSNFPIATGEGLASGYISMKELSGGASYQYDVQWGSQAQAVMTIENEGGIMDVDTNAGDFIVHMAAVVTDSVPVVALEYPVKTLVRLTDINGDVVVANLQLSGTMEAYKIAIPGAGFDKTQVRKIEFIQSPQIDGTNKRGKININFGLQSVDTVIPGVSTGLFPATELGGSPSFRQTGNWISPTTNDLGLAYNFDIKRSKDEIITTIEKLEGTFSVPDNDLVLHAMASSIGAALKPILLPIVKMLVKITDDSGDVIAVTLNLEET